MPRVSVVIPSYNSGRFVGEAIQSVLDQTFQDFEIIVVDDGSTDNTREVVEALKDLRIRYAYQENQGVSAARNTGIKASSGEYIAFLDSDDMWLPEKLEFQVKCLDTAPQAGLVYSDMYHYDTETDTNLRTTIRGRKFLPPRGKVLDRLMKHPYLPNPSTLLVRKQVFDEVGMFDETLRMVEDNDLLLRIAHSFEFELVNVPLTRRRLHKSQLTNEPTYYHWKIVFWNRMMKSQFLNKYRGLMRRKLARLHCYYGLSLIRRGKIRTGIQDILASAKASPGIFLISTVSAVVRKPFLVLASIVSRLRFRPVNNSAVPSVDKWEIHD